MAGVRLGVRRNGVTSRIEYQDKIRSHHGVEDVGYVWVSPTYQSVPLHMRTQGDIQRIADVIGAEAATQLATVFAGRRIYFPKDKLPSVREYILANPDASPSTVIIACQCSRATYYRVRNELRRGNG